ncbi:MAG: hypothetical protein WCI04_06345 [archaeon]
MISCVYQIRVLFKGSIVFAKKYLVKSEALKNFSNIPKKITKITFPQVFLIQQRFDSDGRECEPVILKKSRLNIDKLPLTTLTEKL